MFFIYGPNSFAFLRIPFWQKPKKFVNTKIVQVQTFSFGYFLIWVSWQNFCNGRKADLSATSLKMWSTCQSRLCTSMFKLIFDVNKLVHNKIKMVKFNLSFFWNPTIRENYRHFRCLLALLPLLSQRKSCFCLFVFLNSICFHFAWSHSSL